MIFKQKEWDTLSLHSQILTPALASSLQRYISSVFDFQGKECGSNKIKSSMLKLFWTSSPVNNELTTFISNYYILFVCNWHYISTFTLHVHLYLKLNKWLYDAKRHKGLTVYTQSHWILPLCYLWLRPNCTLIYTTGSCNQPRVFSLVKKNFVQSKGLYLS